MAAALPPKHLFFPKHNAAFTPTPSDVNAASRLSTPSTAEVTMNRIVNYRGYYASRRSNRAVSQELMKHLARTKHETTTVVTMLEPSMQTRLDAAAIGSFNLV